MGHSCEKFREERRDEAERDMITDGGSNEYSEYDPYRVTYDAYNFARPGKLSFTPGSLSGTLAFVVTAISKSSLPLSIT